MPENQVTEKGASASLDRYSEIILRGAKAWNEWRSALSVLPVLDGIVLENLDLEGIDFSGLSMRQVIMQGCNLKNAKLISTKLSHSKLQENNFTNARLIAASFEEADLSGCNLKDASILTANVRGACLDGIDFRGHDLSSLNLASTSLVSANVDGQNLAKMDLAGINFADASVINANLSYANLSGATLKGAVLEGTQLKGVSFKNADLSGVNLYGLDLEGIDLEGANLSYSDLREANLSHAKLIKSNMTGCKLWRVKREHWDISHVICNHAYWSKNGREKTNYRVHEFEKIYAESITVQLRYPYRLTANEVATLPILVEHLQASQWGTILRMRSIKDIAGGAVVDIIVEESGQHIPSTLKEDLQLEADRLQAAQLALRSNLAMQHEIKEGIASIKEKIWPRLLELASEHDRAQARNMTVLFMDLKGFSSWNDAELQEKLALFRGLIKPILKKWQAGHPNMEGDSLRVTFRNAAVGLVCACMMQGVLSAAGFGVRIGVEYGEVAVVHNEVTDVSDLEGTAVSMAARLEASAEPGQVVVSERVRQNGDIHGIFEFMPVLIKLKKSIGSLSAGDAIPCYCVRLLKSIDDAVSILSLDDSSI